VKRLALAAAGAVLLAGCAAAVPAATWSTVPPIPAVAGSLNGVYEQTSPGSYAGITTFAAATGTTPRIALYYSGWWVPFNTRFAEQAHSHGAYTLVQLEPSVPLPAIIAGDDDRYLRSYADAVKAFGHPVILSFGHEMNGRWYQWGEGHTEPSVFIAAWRHIVDVFRAQGASNVTWLWTVNAVNAATAPLHQWWPGTSYVTWVGIDGYYYRPTDTYQWVFGRTVTEIRTFTAAPVLISEVATGPGPDAAAQVRGLFAGIKDDELLGEVWFDEAQRDGIYHQDWRVEDDPAALAAFRSVASGRS